MKITSKFIVAVALMLSAATPSFASEWYYTFVGNKESKFFFEAESIKKIKTTVLLYG